MTPDRRVLLSIDTGLATFGLAAFDVGTRELLQLGLVRTEKSDKKRQVSNSSDVVRRAREVSRALVKFSSDVLRAHGGLVVAVAHESLSLPRNSRAAALIGVSLGLVVHHAEVCDLPILEVYPQDVKQRVTGRKSASKEEIRASLGATLFNLEDCLRALGVARGVEEHPVDAAAVGYCALEHDVLRVLSRS